MARMLPLLFRRLQVMMIFPATRCHVVINGKLIAHLVVHGIENNAVLRLRCPSRSSTGHVRHAVELLGGRSPDDRCFEGASTPGPQVVTHVFIKAGHNLLHI